MIKQEQVKEIPLGVKIISVLYYLYSIAFLIGIIIIASNKDSEIINPTIFSSLLAVPLVLSFFIARGIGKGKRWARIAAIVLSILLIIIVVISAVVFYSLSRTLVENSENIKAIGNLGNILDIVHFKMFLQMAIIVSAINALIAGYLLFSKKINE